MTSRNSSHQKSHASSSPDLDSSQETKVVNLQINLGFLFSMNRLMGFLFSLFFCCSDSLFWNLGFLLKFSEIGSRSLYLPEQLYFLICDLLSCCVIGCCLLSQVLMLRLDFRKFYFPVVESFESWWTFYCCSLHLIFKYLKGKSFSSFDCAWLLILSCQKRKFISLIHTIISFFFCSCGKNVLFVADAS